jgi:hypothetical protein
MKSAQSAQLVRLHWRDSIDAHTRTKITDIFLVNVNKSLPSSSDKPIKELIIRDFVRAVWSSTSMFVMLVQRSRFSYLLVTVGNRLAAFAVLVDRIQAIYIEQIQVLRNFHRHRIGSRISQEIRRKYPDKSLIGSVHPSTEGILSFYKSLGCVVTEVSGVENDPAFEKTGFVGLELKNTPKL